MLPTKNRTLTKPGVKGKNRNITIARTKRRIGVP